jgi:superfamily II DNA or RNA helicase
LESSDDLQAMSRFEDLGGWQPNPRCTLRRGQRDLLRAIQIKPYKETYNGFLPTGYGKTFCAVIAYGTLRSMGRVNRCIVIVPSVQQLRDFDAGLKKACKFLGLEISGHDICGDPRAIRRSVSGEAEIFVTTIQAVQADFEAKDSGKGKASYYEKLLGSGNWLLVADEHHHYRENKAWGEALKRLKRAAELGLSATPLSSKGEVSVIGDDYDVVVSIEEAYNEEAIRRIRGHIMEHHVDIMVGDSDEVIQMTTTEIGQDLMPNESIQSWEVRRKVRYSNNFLSETMGAAVSQFNAKLLQNPGEHQMLVFAMSCRHAQHVCQMLNDEFGSGDGKFADWIGTGPDGRMDNENDRILDIYKANGLPCLVQVDKAGEGFDNPRSSVLVFVNNGKSYSNRSYQQFGRGFRRNYAIEDFEDDVCDIFVSSDSDLVNLVRKLEWSTKRQDTPPDDEDGHPDGPGGPDKFFPIPDLIFVKTKLNYTEMVEPLGSPSEAARRLKENSPDQFGHVPMEALVAACSKAMYEKRKELEAKSDAQEIQAIRDSVKNATNQLALRAAKLRWGTPLPHNGVGRMCYTINTRWKVQCGYGTDEMTRKELSQKYKWVQDIHNTIGRSRCLEDFPWLEI